MMTEPPHGTPPPGARSPQPAPQHWSPGPAAPPPGWGTAAPPAPKRPSLITEVVVTAFGMLAIAVMASGGIAARQPYLTALAVNAGYHGIAAFALAFLLRCGGPVSHAHVALLSVGGVITAALAAKGLPLALAVVAALIAGTLTALLFGAFASLARAAWAMTASLAAGFVAGEIITSLVGFDGISLPQTRLGRDFIALLLVAVLALSATGLIAAERAWLGLAAKPVSTYGTRLAAFVLAGAVCVLNGSFHTMYLSFFDPFGSGLASTLVVGGIALAGGTHVLGGTLLLAIGYQAIVTAAPLAIGQASALSTVLSTVFILIGLSIRLANPSIGDDVTPGR